MPAVAFVGLDGETFAGSGGLAWGKGRCWLWFHVEQGKPEYARPVLSQAKYLLRKARQLGATSVFTVRDKQYETSSRLLKLSGFVFHEIEDGSEVFRCDI